jgi:hypothetical protein
MEALISAFSDLGVIVVVVGSIGVLLYFLRIFIK